jgi:hypothetical protein
MSAYRPAIDHTAQTIQRRARYFRNLVVVVVLIGLVSLAGAALQRSFAPLAGSLVVIPTCAAFFLLDHRLLDQWRNWLLRAWTTGEIDLAAFRAAIRANPALPRDTMEGMLATLPSSDDLVAERGIGVSTRQAVAAELTSRYRAAHTGLALKVAVSLVVVGVLLVAVFEQG